MNIKDFQESLEYLFKSNNTAFVWGHAGIGKSSIIKQYANKKGYHFFPLYLGTQSDLGDVLGLADFVRDKNGTAIATTFATPKWLKEAIDYCLDNPDSGAIIFLDEFNRARRDVLQGMFSLALDKTFHTIKLPANCHIIAAGNPPTEEYQVTDVNETALMARFTHIKLEPTVTEWLEFATKSKMEPSLISFVQESPQLLEDHKSDFELPVKVDRRSYERLNRLFDVNTPQHLMMQLMSGILGVERTVAYQEHLKKADKPLTAEEVFKGKHLAKVESWVNDKDGVKSSLLTGTCDNLKTFFNTSEKESLTEKQSQNLLTFLKTIPVDIFYSLLSFLYQTQRSKVFITFAESNKEDITALIRRAKGHI